MIDVRSAAEYAAGHIEGAISVPLEAFSVDNATLLNFDTDTVILLYCGVGYRSGIAANMLAEWGYTSLYSLEGGLTNWIAVYGEDSLQECSECGSCPHEEIDFEGIEGSELNREIANLLLFIFKPI